MDAGLYIKSKIGEALTQTLAKHESQMSEELIKSFKATFEQRMYQKLENVNKGRSSVKGKIISFKSCDDVWMFWLKDSTLKVDKDDYNNQNLKIVAVDSKRRGQEQPNV